MFAWSHVSAEGGQGVSCMQFPGQSIKVSRYMGGIVMISMVVITSRGEEVGMQVLVMKMARSEGVVTLWLEEQ